MFDFEELVLKYLGFIENLSKPCYNDYRQFYLMTGVRLRRRRGKLASMSQ